MLDELSTRELVVMGMMTSMCVDSTVRAASERGFEVLVVHDACAAPDLTFGDVKVGGAEVHAAFMAAIADGFAEVRTSDGLPRTEPRTKTGVRIEVRPTLIGGDAVYNAGSGCPRRSTSS